MSTLRYYLRPLWRRKWLFLAPAVLLPLVILVATLRQPELHEATADVYVNRQELATTSLVGQTPALDNPDRTMRTHARLARVPVVMERTLEAADSSQIPVPELRSQSSIVPLDDILRFRVSNEDPARAARLASAYASAFVDYRRELDTRGLAPTLEQVRRQIEELETGGRTGSPLYVRLADREQQLESLQALRTSNLSVVRTERASDADQVAPRPRRNAAVALAGGLVLGLVLVFLWESLGTKPRSKEEYEALLGARYLGRLNRGDRGDTALAVDGTATSESDGAHAMRTSFELVNAGIGARTIMVTSPRAGAGKSECALQLAVSLARSGRHVTLVDLDLRASSVTRLAGLDRRLGITSVILGESDLAEVIATIPLEDASVDGTRVDSNGHRSPGALLEVIGSGPEPSVHPAELASSKQAAAVLAELAERADLVLVDVPPLLDAPDAAALAARVDGILLVVSSQDARGPTLADVRRATGTWPAETLGFVLTEGSEGQSSARDNHGVARRSSVPASEPERVG